VEQIWLKHNSNSTLSKYITEIKIHSAHLHFELISPDRPPDDKRCSLKTSVNVTESSVTLLSGTPWYSWHQLAAAVANLMASDVVMSPTSSDRPTKIPQYKILTPASEFLESYLHFC